MDGSLWDGGLPLTQHIHGKPEYCSVDSWLPINSRKLWLVAPELTINKALQDCHIQNNIQILKRNVWQCPKRGHVLQ